MKDGGEAIGAPEHLTPTHDLSAFDSGVPELDEWLRRRALANEQTGASRTYVVCSGGGWSGTTPWRAAVWLR